MPIHGRIAGIAGPFIRSQLRGAARYTYQTLRMQDRIIDKTYRKAGLYNREIVTGIKHGLAGGQIIGGALSLGLNMNDDNTGGAPPLHVRQKRNYKFSKKYSR